MGKPLVRFCEGQEPTGVWTRYCGTAAKAGGKRRRRTSSCSCGRLLPTRKPDELRPTLNDFLWGECSITQAAHNVTGAVKMQNDLLPQAGAVFLVPSSMKTGDIARVLRERYEVSLLNDGFDDLIGDLNLDYLFVDTHPGVNEETLLSIAISDVLLLILRPDKQDFQGISVTVELAVS